MTEKNASTAVARSKDKDVFSELMSLGKLHDPPVKVHFQLQRSGSNDQGSCDWNIWVNGKWFQLPTPGLMSFTKFQNKVLDVTGITLGNVSDGQWKRIIAATLAEAKVAA